MNQDKIDRAIQMQNTLNAYAQIVSDSNCSPRNMSIFLQYAGLPGKHKQRDLIPFSFKVIAGTNSLELVNTSVCNGPVTVVNSNNVSIAVKIDELKENIPGTETVLVVVCQKHLNASVVSMIKENAESARKLITNPIKNTWAETPFDVDVDSDATRDTALALLTKKVKSALRYSHHGTTDVPYVIVPPSLCSAFGEPNPGNLEKIGHLSYDESLPPAEILCYEDLEDGKILIGADRSSVNLALKGIPDSIYAISEAKNEPKMGANLSYALSYGPESNVSSFMSVHVRDTNNLLTS